MNVPATAWMENPNYLEASERARIKKEYSNLTIKFKKWLKSNALKHGYTEAIFDEAKIKTQAEKNLREEAVNYAEQLRKNLGYPALPVDHQVRMEITKTSELGRQADELAKQKVALPQSVLANLDKCVELRTRLAKNFESLPIDEVVTIGAPKGKEEVEAKNIQIARWKKIQADNESHKYFKDVLTYVRGILYDYQYEFAMRMHGVLTEMSCATEAVVDAWKHYKDVGLGLIQATLITNAAIERARDLEKAFRDELAGDENMSKFLTERKLRRRYEILDIPNDRFPDLSRDVRGLLGMDQTSPEFESTSETLQQNLELIHFPAYYVIRNYRAISKLWEKEKEQCPVPGYPVDLTYVHPGRQNAKFQSPGSKGKRKREKEEELEKRKKLKTEYDEQIKLLWTLLNDIKLLQTYKVTEDEKGRKTFAPLQKDDEQELPADCVSQALRAVETRPSEGNILNLSYTIQLLAKIGRLFDQKTCEEKRLLYYQISDEIVALLKTFTEDSVAYWKKRNNQRLESDKTFLFKDLYWHCSGKFPVAVLKECMEAEKNTTPYFSYKYDWRANEKLGEKIYVKKDGNNTGRAVRIPSKDAQLLRIDTSRFPETDIDVTWYAGTENRESYMYTQPVYPGFTALRRRLVEYQADLNFANDRLSIFVFSHLIQALEILDPGDHTVRQDKMVLEQQPDWFPVDPPDNATAFLDMVKARLPKVGENFDYTGAMMKRPKPLDTLWKLTVEGHYWDGKDATLRLATFVKELEEYHDGWELWSKIHTSTRAKRPYFADKLTKVQGQKNTQEQRFDAELSWETVVDVLKKGLSTLPCGELERDFYEIVVQYEEYLLGIGKYIGYKMRKNETAKEYHTRLLFHVLDDFKSREDAHNSGKAGGLKWKDKTHLMKVKAAGYLELKNKREMQREEKRERERKVLAGGKR